VIAGKFMRACWNCVSQLPVPAPNAVVAMDERLVPAAPLMK